MWRSRWAAIGAAIAVSLGAGGLFVAQAAPGPSESTIVTVSPERILDTRDGNDIGLTGPFVSAVSQKLQVTGSIQTATGAKIVVPTGATGVLLNVTPVNPTAAGFISIRPGDATGAATTSSLNFTTGVAGIVPNAVQVAMPTSGANEGEIDITYDAYGQAGPTTDILIDVVGYMTSAGLQELVADVATRANGFVARAPGDLTFTGQDQTVATLSLPAGTYVINASLVANNNAAAQNTVNCDLLLNGTAIDRTSSDPTGIELGNNTLPGSRESIALTGAGTLAAAGNVTIVCDATIASGNWLERTITAIQVATLATSAALDGGAESSSTNLNE
jgi:hypothetical protein